MRTNLFLTDTAFQSDSYYTSLSYLYSYHGVFLRRGAVFAGTGESPAPSKLAQETFGPQIQILAGRQYVWPSGFNINAGVGFHTRNQETRRNTFSDETVEEGTTPGNNIEFDFELNFGWAI